MSLAFSVKRIEETCIYGESIKGSFILDASHDYSISFAIRCSHRRIHISITDFNDVCPEGGIEIEYEIMSLGLDPGTVFKGNISVISNLGEERIPVILSIVREEILTSKGAIRNSFHFANLAKDNFREATDLFYTKEAGHIFEAGDRETFFKYRAFFACAARDKRYEGVEEFLVETNKKTPVIMSFAEGSVMERGVYSDKELSITVRKSGWGFPGFKLKTGDDFIELYKSEYGFSDFEGNFAEIRFKILSDRLHTGHNFGRIDLTSLHSEVSIPVFIDMTGKDGGARELIRSRQSAILRLMSEFINFRIGNTSSDEWIERSNKLVERLLGFDRGDPEGRLMQAQLLLASKRYSEADIVLRTVERELEKRDVSYEIEAYHIYLRAMCDQDDKELNRSVRQVWDLYHRHEDSWRLLWILIYLDESIKMSPERERSLIEDQINRGMRSPLMYLEAYSVLSHDPSLIRKLSEFEINVLGFAVRHSLLKKEIADQVAILSQRMRGYDKRIIKIMGAYYREFNDNEMLASICSYLIRNEITDPGYFPYFEEAVKRDIGVTNLYEYYLYTMNHGATKLLPRSVLMYYGFSNDLPPALKSYVYANMIVNDKEAEAYLAQSLEACTDFAASEILAGNMDENLAIIVDYIDFFREANREKYDINALHNSLIHNGFMRLIIVNDPKIKNVIVIEDAFKDERSVALSDGRAYLSIYDNDHDLFFEDKEGNRYGEKYISYEEIKLLRTGELLDRADFPETDDPGLWVALSERGKSYISVDDKNAAYVRSIIDSDLINDSFKEGLLILLLRFYYDNDMQSELTAMLSSVDVSKLTMEERNEYIRFCSIRSDDEEAYRVIASYGSYGMEPKTLMRIATRLIEKDKEVDDVLMEIAAATFRGNKYNEVILKLVSAHFEGTLRELKDIWKACRDFDTDASVIEGRIIEQMLYTGAYIGERDEIFFDYLKGDASKHVVSEYFKRSAEDNFYRDTVFDDRLFMGMLDFAIDEKLTDAEALCLIRFFEQKRDMRTDKILYPHIRDLAERDIVFDFFLSYKDLLPALSLFDEYVFLDYRGAPGKNVTLSYCLNAGESRDINYKKEEMRELYPGVYQSRGLVFPGEELLYYITVDGDDHTLSDVVRSEERLTNGDKRYDILQDALLSLQMEDMDSFLELCEDYMIKDKIVKEVIWAE